jgi:uridine kinase
MIRTHLLEQLAERIVSLDFPHPVRVAIDGIDAAGKTTLANELAPLIEARGRRVIRASIDGFHRPRAERYRRGADSPEGYYYDSFDYPALRAALLNPLGPGGDRRYRTAVFDVRADAPVAAPVQVAPADAILIFDGVFLQRPELCNLWDYRVFVDVDFAESVARAALRDAHLGSPAAARARYWQRYVPGQRLYLDGIRPRERSEAVVDNNDPENPTLVLRT